ncbi:MAG: TMEM175 family protein [Betaproteobacteria bacterium]
MLHFSFWNNPAPEGFGKSRIEALADGIFSVAMTLLVLEIKLPPTEVYATESALWQRLLSLEGNITIYVISFLVLGMFWVSHHYQFHFVQRTDRALLWINLLFLLAVSTVPFSTALLGQHTHLWLPFLLYSLNLLVLVGFFYMNINYLGTHPALSSPSLTPEIIRGFKIRQGLFALVPVLSAAVALYSPRFALYLYFLLALLHFVPRGDVREPIARDALRNDSDS